MEIDEDRIPALKDAVHRAIVQIQKAKRVAMTSFSLGVRDVQHVGQIQDVGIKMYAIKSVGDGAFEIGEIGIAYIFFDLDILQRESIDLGLDALCGSLLIPGSRSHFGLLN
jgi:hypothetical protein